MNIQLKSLEVDMVVESLMKNGIFTIEEFLNSSILEKLHDEFNNLFFQNTSGVRPEYHPYGRSVRLKLDQFNKEAIPTILTVFTSRLFRDITSKYLPKGSTSMEALVATHETKSGKLTDVHFDTPRSLKFMIYLTDTNKTNGAFSYAPGTHKVNATFRKNFLVCGNRLSELPNVVFDTEGIELIPISAPAGSLIIFDTEGFHSGGHMSPSTERKVLRSRSIFANQPVLHPLRFSRQWFWESGLNPLRIFAPKCPEGRKSTNGSSRAQK